MESGHFSNLVGIEPVMAYFGIDSLVFNDEWVEVMAKYQERFSLGFLRDMSPSLYNGKLYNGKEHDRVDYVKVLIVKRGLLLSGEDLDDLVEKLWQVREVLFKLDRLRVLGHIRNTREISGRRVLAMLTADTD